MKAIDVVQSISENFNLNELYEIQIFINRMEVTVNKKRTYSYELDTLEEMKIFMRVMDELKIEVEKY